MLTEVNKPQKVEIRRSLLSLADEAQILGCVSCKWVGPDRRGESAVVSATQIAACNGMRIGPVADRLEALAESRIIKCYTADKTDPGDKVYGPGDTRQAMKFWTELELLEQSEPCHLE